MSIVSEIERLQQIINELKQENLELGKHNQILQDEVSKLTDMLDNVEFFTTDDDDDEATADEPKSVPVESNGEAADEENAEWLPLKGFNDYVIKNYYPYDIKRVSTGHIVKECKLHGYVGVNLFMGNNSKPYMKHVLIARQFIPNDDPEHKTMVDHKNMHKDDNHISNLRWVSASENQQNKSSHGNIEYEFVKDIPNDAIVVDTYGKHKFENYYFHDDKFYFYNGVMYRVLHICTNKTYGSKLVNAITTEGNRINIYYSKFKRLYNLE